MIEKYLSILILSISFISIVNSQKPKYKEHYTCEEIRRGAFKDTILYVNVPNGGIIADFHANKYQIYEVRVDDQLKSYVTEPLKTYLENSIIANKCSGIRIDLIPVTPRSELKVIRD